MEKVHFGRVHIYSKCVSGNPANLIDLNVYCICKSTCIHTHTQTMPTDLINLHVILLRKERRLEMRSVYLQWYGLLVTNERLWLLVLGWYFELTMFGWESNTVMEERQKNVRSCSNSSAPEWVDAMRHNNACNHRN